jgi:hypothetical protein
MTRSSNNSRKAFESPRRGGAYIKQKLGYEENDIEARLLGLDFFMSPCLTLHLGSHL